MKSKKRENNIHIEIFYYSFIAILVIFAVQFVFAQTPSQDGCYDKLGNKQDFNSLTPNDFGSYVTDTGQVQTNPDESNAACNCIIGSVWDNNGKCCGDDLNDCGLQLSGNLCQMSSTNPSAWVQASIANLGDIRYVECARAEYLSTNGNIWKKCDGVFWTEPIGGRDYLCIGAGRGSIVECCGDSGTNCGLRGAGQQLTTGKSVKPSNFISEPIVQGSSAKVPAAGNANTYYCTQNKKFVTDLDQPNLEFACKKAGFNWTGTKCCSEDDDNSTCSPYFGQGCPEVQGCIPDGGEGCIGNTEYYNDPGQRFACWKSLVIESGSYVKDTDYSVINYLGEFHGCAIAQDSLKGIKDTHSQPPTPLITNHHYCSNNPVQNYYCSYSGMWNLTQNKDKSHLSFVPSTGIGSIFKSDGTPYFTFYPNDGTMVAGMDSFVFTLNGAQPSDKLSVDIYKNGNPAGSVVVCEVGPGQSSCASSAVSQQVDVGRYMEDVFINNQKRGTINVEVVSSSAGNTFRSEGDPYFIFAPNNGILVAGRDSFTFELHGNPGDTLSVNAFKDGNSIGSILVCAIPVGSNSCTSSAIPQQENVGFYKEDVLINGQVKGAINLLVISGQAECCGNNECWDGNKCINNQNLDPTSKPILFYRCIDGIWTPSQLKFTPDGSEGYCAKETQCLAKEATLLKCVESGFYINDDYCEDGNWTSRTKLLALKLLRIKELLGFGDFKIFCDNKENTLNYLQYTIGTSTAANILELDLKANNFCVLNSTGQIIVAGTVNQDLRSILTKNIFGISICDNPQAFVDSDSHYRFCDSAKKLWFSQKLKSFIFSNKRIDVPPDYYPQSILRDLIKNIVDKLKQLVSSPPIGNTYDDSFIKGIKKFDRLYVDVALQGARSISGSIEGIGSGNRNAVFQYKGLNFDICGPLKLYNQTKKQDSKNDQSGIVCKNENGIYYVLAQGNHFTLIDPDKIWPDMTSKLRLK